MPQFHCKNLKTLERFRTQAFIDFSTESSRRQCHGATAVAACGGWVTGGALEPSNILRAHRRRVTAASIQGVMRINEDH
jgi:hypothetical protein